MDICFRSITEIAGMLRAREALEGISSGLPRSRRHRPTRISADADIPKLGPRGLSVYFNPWAFLSSSICRKS
jgi:hypothetical protein